MALAQWDNLILCHENPRQFGNKSDRYFFFTTIDAIINCRIFRYKLIHQTNARVYANYPEEISFSLYRTDPIYNAVQRIGEYVTLVIPQEADIHPNDLSRLQTLVQGYLKDSLLYQVQSIFMKEI
ncbi:hypothetical protein [Paenibacillus sp. NPDC055715]